MEDKPKHPGGRPPLYTSSEELEKLIREYFDHCDNRVRQVYSAKMDGVVEILDPAPYTMSGLAVFLGMDRKSLLNYSKKDEFFLTIKNARDRVEADVEERMNDKQTFTPGLIFNAKNNFDWKDKSETDVTSKGETINPYAGLTTDELRKLADK